MADGITIGRRKSRKLKKNKFDINLQRISGEHKDMYLDDRALWDKKDHEDKKKSPKIIRSLENRDSPEREEKKKRTLSDLGKPISHKIINLRKSVRLPRGQKIQKGEKTNSP
jgi:hypothetical protein